MSLKKGHIGNCYANKAHLQHLFARMNIFLSNKSNTLLVLVLKNNKKNVPLYSSPDPSVLAKGLTRVGRLCFPGSFL